MDKGVAVATASANGMMSGGNGVTNNNLNSSNSSSKKHNSPKMVFGGLLFLIVFIVWRFSVMMPVDTRTSTSSQTESNLLKHYLQSLQTLAAASANVTSTLIETTFSTASSLSGGGSSSGGDSGEEVDIKGIDNEDLSSLPCEDPVWCSIPMPKKSHFRLSRPKNAKRWRQAQIQASNGEHILLNRIRTFFPNAFDFLDGDIKFAHYHYLADHFIDRNNDLLPYVRSPLVKVQDSNSNDNSKVTPVKMLETNKPKDDSRPKRTIDKLGEVSLTVEGDYTDEIPFTYLADKMDRAPIIQIGYTKFERNYGDPYFKGHRLEDKNVLRIRLFDIWENAKKQAGSPKSTDTTAITKDSGNSLQLFRTPIIFMSNLNENWGIFSMVVPNRTAEWFNCCPKVDIDRIMNILNDDQVLALFTQQHHNLSHPKLISTPRGLSLQEHNMRLYIWDLMHTIPTNPQKMKTALVYTASSNWGYRPVLKQCILNNFNVVQPTTTANTTTKKPEKLIEFDSYDKKLQGRVNEATYYMKLINSRMTIALPGLGYDSYRLWESLTLGLVPVLERGIGLDKTVWKLPVLLVDDYADVNEALLRSAYVEALYQVNNFEFERLTQSWWYTLILETSASKSSKFLQEKFPPESQDDSFVRPIIRFDCWKTNSCGPGTKRIPKVVC